jgi:hypothetical protein
MYNANTSFSKIKIQKIYILICYFITSSLTKFFLVIEAFFIKINHIFFDNLFANIVTTAELFFV